MKYNSKKFYLFLSVLRVLILIILLNHMKIVFSKMAYLYLFIEYMVKMEYIIKNKNAIDFFIKIIYNITRESVINTYLL